MCSRSSGACEPRPGATALESRRDEDRRLRQARARGADPHRSLDQAPRPVRRGRAQPFRRERRRGGAAPQGRLRHRGRRRLSRAAEGARLAAQSACDGRRPCRARFRRRGRRFRPRRDEPPARRRARAAGGRPRPLRPAGRRRRRCRLVGGCGRAARPAGDLAGDGALGGRRLRPRQAADGVRVRHDRGAAARGRRGERCDQRAALPVPQGDHGREEEAAGRPLSGRPRCRRRSGRRGGLPHHGARARRPTGTRRRAQDRGRRERCASHRRLPRGKEARLSTLVFLEHHGNELQKGSLGVLAKVASLGAGDAAAVIAGEGARALAAEAATYGASKVWVCEDGEVAQPLPQPRVDVLAQVIDEGGYDTVLFANSVLAADVAAGLAARLDAGLNWDLVDVELRDGELVGKRSALQDPVYAAVGGSGTPRLPLFRAGSFDATPAGGGEPEITDISASYKEYSTAVKLVGQDAEESSGPSIEDADVIVAGGRGLGSPDNFTLAEELAKALGGAVGATRAVVDAGWYPYSAQIGQTGKTVSPKLYVALGISGAIQHKAGMQSSGTIVAINKDANAPIFEFSDLGVVGDVHEIVPKLTELVRARRG